MPTISPDYQQKGIWNPYYNIDPRTDRAVTKVIAQDYDIERGAFLRYKNIYTADIKNSWDLIKTVSKGKFVFQIEVFGDEYDKVPLPYYISVAGKDVKGHWGMATRKDSTASSNVNEYLTVYFLKHNDFTDAKDFMNKCCKEGTKTTGIFTGEEHNITYSQLKDLIDKDETPERDIEIGYKNAIAVKKDLKANKQTWKKLYWTPRQKPAGIGEKNPSDVIIEMKGGCFLGYSNKISSGGADATPKFNTNIFAFFGKLGDAKQQKASEKMMNASWAAAVKKVKKPSSLLAVSIINIANEAPSESSSKNIFGSVAKTFTKDRLDFYKKDFYYNYRESLIKAMIKHITQPTNLVYFLNTIAFYTFGSDGGDTPCPYKLLVGSPTGSSTIKEVSEDEKYREMLTNKSSRNLKRIRSEFTTGTQSFKIKFNFFHHSVVVPITMRTRAAGGWSGKSLYITSPGIVMD